MELKYINTVVILTVEPSRFGVLLSPELYVS